MDIWTEKREMREMRAKRGKANGEKERERGNEHLAVTQPWRAHCI